MREAILILLVIGLSAAGLAKPRVALIAYIWFAVMRPDVLAWATDRPYSMVLGAVAVLSCLRELPYVLNIFQSRWMVLFLALMGWITLSVITSEYLPESLLMYRIFLPTLLTAFLVPVVLRTFEDVRLLYLVLAFSLGALGLKFGLWGVIHGGVRLTGGYGGSLSDNNLFALAMVVALPLCWYARSAVESPKWKLMFLAFSVFTIPATILTHSRGAALSLALTVLFIVWHSRHRWATMVALAILLVPSTLLVKDSFMERMRTLSDYESDLSAQNRLHYWRAAYRLTLDYPVVGVGFGGLAYVNKVGKYLPPDAYTQYAHNNYLQMSADSGIPALLLLCILQFGQLLWFRSAGKKFKDKDPVMYAMTMGMSGALVGLSLGSVFLSRTYWETVYYLFALGAAFGPVIQQRLQTIAAAPAPAAVEEPAALPAVTPEPPKQEPARYKLGGRQRLHGGANVPAGTGRTLRRS